MRWSEINPNDNVVKQKEMRTYQITLPSKCLWARSGVSSSLEQSAYLWDQLLWYVPRTALHSAQRNWLVSPGLKVILLSSTRPEVFLVLGPTSAKFNQGPAGPNAVLQGLQGREMLSQVFGREQQWPSTSPSLSLLCQSEAALRKTGSDVTLSQELLCVKAIGKSPGKITYCDLTQVLRGGKYLLPLLIQK